MAVISTRTLSIDRTHYWRLAITPVIENCRSSSAVVIITRYSRKIRLRHAMTSCESRDLNTSSTCSGLSIGTQQCCFPRPNLQQSKQAMTEITDGSRKRTSWKVLLRWPQRARKAPEPRFYAKTKRSVRGSLRGYRAKLNCWWLVSIAIEDCSSFKSPASWRILPSVFCYRSTDISFSA